MTPGEIVAIVLIALVIGGAAFYIVKAKKSGKKCIGCPFADGCKTKNGTCCHLEKEETIGAKESPTSTTQDKQNKLQ